MIISLIAAMAENRVIGYRNKIPWNIPSDQKLFQKITMGHPIILGRKTFESIGHALAGRINIVLTTRRNYEAEGALTAHNIKEALTLCGQSDEVFICGGGMVFQETIGIADRIYLSVIHRSYQGDTFFPEIPAKFEEQQTEEIQDNPPYNFIRYVRK